MNEMQPFEVDAILENADYIDSFEWDRTRLQMLSILAPNSKKTLKATDIISFPWDKETGAEKEITESDIERLRKQAKQLVENGSI